MNHAMEITFTFTIYKFNNNIIVNKRMYLFFEINESFVKKWQLIYKQN